MSDWRRIWGLTIGEFQWIFVAGLTLLAYELLAVFAPKEWGLDVLTRAYRANMTRWTVFPVGVGVLMGHLHGALLPGSGLIGKYSPFIWVTIVVAVGVQNLVRPILVPLNAIAPIFLWSFCVGYLFWRGSP